MAAENRRAAEMAAGATPSNREDALRILALRTAECLDGGRAAILRPERRRRLLRVAHMLGVKQFDANLVIAIVQDNARRGAASTSATDPRLAVMTPPTGQRIAPPSALHWIVPQIVGAVALAALLFLALVRWIGG